MGLDAPNCQNETRLNPVCLADLRQEASVAPAHFAPSVDTLVTDHPIEIPIKGHVPFPLLAVEFQHTR